MATPFTTSEILIRVVDEHWMIYVRPFFFCLLVSIAGFSSLFLSAVTLHHSDWIYVSSFLFGIFCLLLALHCFFMIVMSEALSQIIITSKRVVHFDDFVPFKEDMLEVSFDKMKTVEVEKHGIIPSLLNYGTLNFESGKAKIYYVPHPNSVARDIYQAMGLL